jgi:hypothetical protein
MSRYLKITFFVLFSFFFLTVTCQSNINSTYRQDIVPSLILAPIRSGLRGFCLFILEIFSMEYQQKNPLKYYALPFLFEFVSNVHFRLGLLGDSPGASGFAEEKAMSALFGLKHE